MEKLTNYLNSKNMFRKARKKIKKYIRTMTPADATPQTFYIHQGKPQVIVTRIGDEKETRAIAKQGDYVITGPLGEKYVVRSENVPQFYNLVDGILYTRPTERFVAKVPKSLLKQLNLPDIITFETSWKAHMILKPGDYLVKDGSNYYRVEKKAFNMTYRMI